MQLKKNLFSKLITLANLESHSQKNLPFILHTNIDGSCAITRQIIWGLTLAKVKWYRHIEAVSLNDSAVSQITRVKGLFGPAMQVGSNICLDPISSLQMLQSLRQYNFLAESSSGASYDSWPKVQPFVIWTRDFLKGVSPLIFSALKRKALFNALDFQYCLMGQTQDTNYDELDHIVTKTTDRAIKVLEYNLDILETTLAKSQSTWLLSTFQPHAVDLMAASVLYPLISLAIEANVLCQRKKTMTWFENFMWFVGEEDPIEDLALHQVIAQSKRFAAVDPRTYEPLEVTELASENVYKRPSHFGYVESPISGLGTVLFQNTSVIKPLNLQCAYLANDSFFQNCTD